MYMYIYIYIYIYAKNNIYIYICIYACVHTYTLVLRANTRIPETMVRRILVFICFLGPLRMDLKGYQYPRKGSPCVRMHVCIYTRTYSEQEECADVYTHIYIYMVSPPGPTLLSILR